MFLNPRENLGNKYTHHQLEVFTICLCIAIMARRGRRTALKDKIIIYTLGEEVKKLFFKLVKLVGYRAYYFYSQLTTETEREIKQYERAVLNVKL